MNDLHFLMVDDDEIERLKFKRVLQKSGYPHRISEAQHGEEALALLQDTDNLPDVILLDLNMPKMNGLEFLTILKADEVLKYIPAIILTTSNNHNDVLESYKIGIAGYVMKPLKYEDYTAKIQNLVAYWSSNELIQK